MAKRASAKDAKSQDGLMLGRLFHIYRYVRHEVRIASCPRLPPRQRLRRKIIIRLWRASGFDLWVPLLVLKIFTWLDAIARAVKEGGGALRTNIFLFGCFL